MFGAIRYVECIYILLVKVCVGRNDRAFDEITLDILYFLQSDDYRICT